MNIENPVEYVQKQLNDIIDQIHPLFTPISDEELVVDYDEYGVFERAFLHKTGKKFLMKWRVYYGTPETVRTVFEPAVEINS